MNELKHIRKPTILIVDDDDVFVELLSDELSLHFVVEWARDGRTVLDAVRRQTPDAIFVDQGLPDITGVQLIEEIRKCGCDSPVVMLTASQDVRVAAAAMRAGAIDFIVKDVNEHFYEDIVPTALRAVEKWNTEKELEYLREQKIEQARQTSELNDQLRDKNEQLEKAFKEIAASQVQLKEKNKRLSELYETAHRFVDNVSHEMRTPLTVIKEFLSIILDGLAGETSEQQQEYLNIAMAKTNDLAQMVNDMLDISKIEARLLRVERARCRFQEIVAGVDDILQQKSRSSRIHLQIEIEDDLPDLYCDIEKAGRSLINLLVNATKFSSEDTSICLWARRSGQPDEILVGLTDQGSGIAPENLQIIFERFKQVGENRRSSTRGFGLGLNIVKELVNLNLGDVMVESELGKGSTFSFSIPIFDYSYLMNRYLNRLRTIDNPGSHLTIAQAKAVNPVSDISSHIRSFVSHHSSAYDLAFERSHANDVILVAATSDPQAMVNRLRFNNQEEMRMSPGSTVDLRFDILHNYELTEDRSLIVDSFVSLFEAVAMEHTDESQESINH